MTLVAKISKHPEGLGLMLNARPEVFGNLIVRSYVTSGTLKVYAPSSDTPIAEITLLFAADPPLTTNCMFETLQTDASWKPDTDGYTFAYYLDTESAGMVGGVTYRVEVDLIVDGLSTPAWPLLADLGRLPLTWFIGVKGRVSA